MVLRFMLLCVVVFICALSVETYQTLRAVSDTGVMSVWADVVDCSTCWACVGLCFFYVKSRLS